MVRDLPWKKWKIKQTSHFGLALIHEGVVLLNGTIHISSEIGQGTTIDIKIPLDLHLAEK